MQDSFKLLVELTLWRKKIDDNKESNKRLSTISGNYLLRRNRKHSKGTDNEMVLSGVSFSKGETWR